jgi:PAS domain S-box-containing protein
MAISDLRGIFRRVNRSWERVLGHPVSALTTRPFLSFIHEDDRAKTEEAMVKLKEGKPIRGFINRYRHIDGTCRIMQWNADFDPETGYIFAIARDITQLLREVQLDF